MHERKVAIQSLINAENSWITLCTQKSNKKGLSRFTQKLYLRIQKYFGFASLEGKKVEICVLVYHLRL